MVLKKRRKNLCGGGGLYKYTISNITPTELSNMVHELLSTEIIPKDNITYNSRHKNTFSIIITAIFKKSIVFSNKNIAFLYFYINYFIYNIKIIYNL